MSRNKEKAQAGLNRFQALKNKEAGVLESNPNLRPKYVQSVQSIPQAEKWRSVVISEISVKLTRISDAATSDFVLRELNDSLNKLFKEKRAWEHHIKALGGNDYINFGKDLSSGGVIGSHIDESGNKVAGYRYFGRAKDLPDVKPLLQASQQTKLKPVSKAAKILQKTLPNSYYGSFDEKNPTQGLLKLDDIDRINNICKSLNESKVEENDEIDTSDDKLLQFERQRSNELMRELSKQSKTESEFTMVDFEKVVPSQEQVSQWILDKKRRELIEKLGIE